MAIIFMIIFALSFELASVNVDFLFYLIYTFIVVFIISLIIFLGFNLKPFSKILFRFSFLLLTSIILIIPIGRYQNLQIQNNSKILISNLNDYYNENKFYPNNLNDIIPETKQFYWSGLLQKKYNYLKTEKGFCLIYYGGGKCIYKSEIGVWAPL